MLFSSRISSLVARPLASSARVVMGGRLLVIEFGSPDTSSISLCPDTGFANVVSGPCLLPTLSVVLSCDSPSSSF